MTSMGSIHPPPPTFTTHPKVDPITGELITMGYEGKGDLTTDISYFLFDKYGKKLEEFWFNAPYAGMMHDMAATDKFVVFVLTPLAAVSMDLLKQGHKHFAWDEEKPLMFGIVPRRNPKPEDVKWPSIRMRSTAIPATYLMDSTVASTSTRR